MNSFVILMYIYLMPASYSAASDRNTIPVFMLDYEHLMVHVQIDPNPFQKLKIAMFSDIIHDSAKRSAGIIIFVEETFSVECISTKDSFFGTPYKHLSSTLLANKNKVKYFPSVIEPYTLLKEIFPPEKNNVYFITPRAKFKLENNFKYLYIYFRDGDDETKAETLRRHDAIIKEVVSAVRQLKAGPVIAYYTGKINPVDVQQVEFVKSRPVESSRQSGVLVVSPMALFRLYGVSSATATRRSWFDNTPLIAKETKTKDLLITKMSYGNFDLEWGFKINNDNWELTYLAVLEGGEEVGRSMLNIGAPINNSYYCDEPLAVRNSRDKSTITLDEYLIEPLTDKSRVDFSPSISCQPYFKASVLSCFFVIFILLAILFYGIIMLINCGNNDRFEDPNSKPLTHELMH